MWFRRWGVVRRHPRCRPGCRARHPGCRARHPGCRPGSRARHPGCRPGVPTPGTRGAGQRHPELVAPDAARGTRGAATGCRLFAPAQVWAARVPGAAPGAASGVPRPGCRVGRDAMEIHISSVSRAYLGSNLLIASSSARAARQVWGAAPRHGTSGAAPGAGTRGAGSAPEVPAPY